MTYYAYNGRLYISTNKDNILRRLGVSASDAARAQVVKVAPGTELWRKATRLRLSRACVCNRYFTNLGAI